MSELSREQVELIALSFADDGMSYEQRQAMQRLEDSDAALRAKLEASEKECASWRTVLENEREAAQKKLEAMRQERDEYKEVTDWYGNLVRLAKIGTKAIPSLRAHVEQIEQQLAAMTQRAKEAEAKWHRAATHDSSIDEAERIHELEQQLAEAQATIAQLEEIGRLKESIEKLLTFNRVWERAYREECRYHSNNKTGEDRQAYDRRMASGKETTCKQ